MMTPMAASLIVPMTSSLIQPVISSLINRISGKEVKRSGKKQEREFLPLLALLLVIKAIFAKVVTRSKKYDKTAWKRIS